MTFDYPNDLLFSIPHTDARVKKVCPFRVPTFRLICCRRRHRRRRRRRKLQARRLKFDDLVLRHQSYRFVVRMSLNVFVQL